VAARDHWIAERLLDRSGIPVAHLRLIFFAEWLMYVAKFIKQQNQLILPFFERTGFPLKGVCRARTLVGSISAFWVQVVAI
jgi:uncharacterized protein YbjT (DUF2867 family)